MVRLYIKSVKADILSVIADIKENNELEKVGGNHCLMDKLQEHTEGAIDIQYLSSKIKDCSIKRQAIENS
jgi:replicative DNA helicase